MIHAKTRKKSIVETFATLGLSISYRRVQEIQDIITRTLCQKYEQDGLVCPPTLKEGLFTTAAIDNIDHNPSSSTAESSFHGTSISIFQYTDESDPPMQFSYDPTGVMKATTNKLPDFYTNIAPTKGGKTEPPALHPNEDLFPANFSTSAVASVWLHKLEKSITVDELSLPLLEESINSPAMVRHCMNIIKGLTDYLNPQQISIITGDQPVYAIGKQVQWTYPNIYNDLVRMMGPLHIEMAFISTIGDWLDGSGWTDAFEKAKITTTGRIESFLKGKKVKRTRYAHQLSLSSLVKLSRMAFEEQSDIDSLSEWKNIIGRKSATAAFWFAVVDMPY